MALMTDTNSGHVQMTTTEFLLTTTISKLEGDDVHHVNIVFIALILGSLSCVIVTFIFMFIKRRKGGLRSRGDSIVIEEISLHPWKIKTPSSGHGGINKIQNNVQIQIQQNDSNDSSDDIKVNHINININDDDDDDEDDDDDDMYLEPKKSVSSYSNHLNKKISISVNNKFALDTNYGNDELIEGNELLTEQLNIDINESNDSDDGHIRNGTMGIESEDDYSWIEMALRTIDENDWAIYLNRFKQNKVTTYRLNTLKDEDFKELLPEIGIRREFNNLLQQKLN